MQKRYSISLKNFLENKKFNNKSVFINANDELLLENDNKKVEISLYSWSNKKIFSSYR